MLNDARMPEPYLDLYGSVLRNALFPTWEGLIRRRPTRERLLLLEQTQWRPFAELRALQAGALRRLLRHAVRNVPFYLERFLRAGVVPEDIRGPEDLPRLPLLTREEARDSISRRTSRVAPRPDVLKSTSGTLGKPLVFGYERDSDVWRNAVRLRGYAWAGYPIGARSLHYWSVAGPESPLFTRAKVALDRALKRELFIDCMRRDDESLAAVVDCIRSHRPDVIVAYTQAAAELARFIIRERARTWDTIPVICGAERLFDSDREVLQEAFGPAVFETYGCREFMLIASECEVHDGLHQAMENLIVEIVVREGDRDRPAEPGETGEVVITDLHNWAMPFIRYLNGDLAVARPPDRCDCGRELLRMGPIEGRVTETLRDAEGNTVNGILVSVLIVEMARHVRQYQAVQREDGSITLKIVPDGDLSDGFFARMRERCGRYLPGVSVDIEVVDDIPLGPSGKRQVLVSSAAAAQQAPQTPRARR